MKDDFTARVIRSLNWLQYGTNFLWVLIFRIFAIFQRSAKKGSRLKRYRKHSSRKNLLQSQEPIQILPSSFLPFLTHIYLFPFLQKLSFFPISILHELSLCAKTFHERFPVRPSTEDVSTAGRHRGISPHARKNLWTPGYEFRCLITD